MEAGSLISFYMLEELTSGTVLCGFLADEIKQGLNARKPDAMPEPQQPGIGTSRNTPLQWRLDPAHQRVTHCPRLFHCPLSRQ